MYIAIELDDDKEVNDIGATAKTPEEAWTVVSHVFHAPDTIIYELTPVFKVKEKKSKLIPIKE